MSVSIVEPMENAQNARMDIGLIWRNVYYVLILDVNNAINIMYVRVV